jgi:hypothetical protein
MKRTCWPVALLVVLLAGQELHAQFLFGLPVPGYQVGVGYVRVRKHSALAFGLARGYGGLYAPGYPYASSITRIQVITPPPPPPVILQVAPLLPAELFNPPSVTLPSYDDVMAARPPAPEPPLPGREAGVFRPIDPDNRARARQPFKPDQPPAPPPERGKPPKKELPGPPPRLPRPPGPNADPKQESLRLIDLGKDAFANQEYGRAAERFRQAIDADPNAALPHFLLAQAEVALGKYRVAYDSIQKGLILDPGWPARRFRPVELYGDNLADYDAHLNALEDVRVANPGDAVLLFLSGYELWFDGRKDEARVLFERAAPALPDRGVVERFLQALPGVPVV